MVKREIKNRREDLILRILVEGELELVKELKSYKLQNRLDFINSWLNSKRNKNYRKNQHNNLMSLYKVKVKDYGLNY